MKVSIIGSGSFGTAISILLGNKGYNVYTYDRNSELINFMREKRENERYLKGVKLPDNVTPVSTLEEAVKDTDVFVLAVPSHGIREICLKIKAISDTDKVIVNLSKGIENGTLLTMSQVIEEILPKSKVVVLSGPSHAEEVSRGIPTTVVVSSKHKQEAENVQDMFMTSNFRVYTNDDLIGVELGGTVKNVIALAAGIADGIGYGDNTKAALMTRGIVEIGRLGVALGAKGLTFAGLSGIGDLIVTCTSMHSRNRRAGILIGQGKTMEEALREVNMVVEGISATESTYHLSRKVNVDMPIVEALYSVLFEGKNAKDAVSELMIRDKAHEIDSLL
ncbi:NAD(P)H-dependent glycerol-3-phosphate dehydrogenase [Clostridium cylindrosporum]|uniref:Glycerol-3-phosphate dehydrogenase [NAD(P)+] n=1 Tax=Clostridium cylindrosporum DSM 605 TaxID=1121307 RepID=A0A0J8D6E6_CLOCY|nr:NAD(P)H-dependent glycerol-3-phosphate dehydrogenase [Clostridium cylindrosporum]KMT21427.1 glycerol-3-phosphate dehydrogenase [Clostridium cylindrosporum DSM 605]